MISIHPICDLIPRSHVLSTPRRSHRYCPGFTRRRKFMERHSYRDRDYAFGQMMLTLRTAIGLTQTGLPDYRGVSRRAVGDSEPEAKYPKPETLRRSIVPAARR